MHHTDSSELRSLHKSFTQKYRRENFDASTGQPLFRPRINTSAPRSRSPALAVNKVLEKRAAVVERQLRKVFQVLGTENFAHESDHDILSAFSFLLRKSGFAEVRECFNDFVDWVIENKLLKRVEEVYGSFSRQNSAQLKRSKSPVRGK